jgi:hypothetical protein
MNSPSATRNLKFWQRIDYGLLLALVIPLFVVGPLLTHAGLPNTADGPAHLMRQVELNQAWQQGNFYPRWGTDLALGHGMPIFSYAPPALYQLTQIFHRTGLPLDEAMKAVLVLDFLLYSGGMFLFARRVYGPVPALVAAAMYVYAPYRLREAFIQGNYGQFTGLAFYPLILWGFHGLITDGRLRYWVAASVALAGLLFSHNISFMMFGPLFAGYLIFLLVLTAWQSLRVSESINGRTSRPSTHTPGFISLLIPPLLRTIAAGLLGLGLSAIFWLPAFGERHDIKLEGITQTFFDFRENFIMLPEFLSPPFPLDLTAVNPYFPLSLGLPQIIGALLALVGMVLVVIKWMKKRNSETAKQQSSTSTSLTPNALPPFFHTLFFIAALILYAFLAIPVSQFLWEFIPLLELAEFPWRMLGPAIFCASILGGAAYWIFTCALPSSPLTPRAMAISLLVTVFGIIAFNAYYLYPSQFISWGTPSPADAFAYEVQSGAIGTTSTGEFLPRWAQQHPVPQTLWPDYEAGRPPQKIDPTTLPAGATVETLAHLSESDSWLIDTPEEFIATIRTLYWPGWKLYLDGQPAPFTITEDTGLIQTIVPAGQHTLTLQLEPTPLRTTGRWLTFITVFLLVTLMVMGIKQNKWYAPAVGGQSPVISSPGFFALATIALILFYLFSRLLAPLFVRQSDPNQPLPASRIVQADFGNQLRLVGVDPLPEVVRPGDTLAITVYWRALQDLDTNYATFLHLDTPTGQTLATVDEVDPEYIPTRNWPFTMYLRNLLKLDIPPDIPPIRYDLNVGAYNNETGENLTLADGSTRYGIGSVWVAAPEPALPATSLAHFGPHITLRHAEFDGELLVLYWKTGAPLAQDYSIFIHLLDFQGNIVAQADGVPYNGDYPLPNWRPEHVIVDARYVGSLMDNETQPRAIAVGIYNPATGERLPASDDAGNPLPNNVLLLPVGR